MARLTPLTTAIPWAHDAVPGWSDCQQVDGCPFNLKFNKSEQDEIHFLRAILNVKHRPINKADFKLPTFTEIMAYLNKVNKIKMNWLITNDYTLINKNP
ncbi:MAG: hypothetical protein L3J98_09050 [Gammaproteobacteria bacterium]|nr:hypothetical protein [Gammaproteobacteria bacterium]MCF6260288.1 hypothetical protein [Gammaproteobacteria bacterium]